MKVPPNQSNEHVISDGLDNNVNDSDNDLNDAPHSPSREGDFSEYLWMENEEEFEQQIMQQLEEEALMQQCIEAMQDELHQSSFGPTGSNYQNGSSSGNVSEDTLSRGIQNLSVCTEDLSQVCFAFFLS